MEILDIYDRNKNKINKTYIKGSNNLKENEYVMVVEIIIINSKDKILLTQRSETKEKNPLKWEPTQGSVKSKESAKEAAIREISEEIGIDVSQEKIKYFKTIKDDIEHNFKELLYIKKDINNLEFNFTDNEVCNIKWVTIKELKQMLELNEIANNMDFKIEEIEEIMKKEKENN